MNAQEHAVAALDNQALLELLQRDGELVTERLAHWARTKGDQLFYLYGEDDVRLSYAEFDRITDAIAGNLAAAGIGRGMPVSVFMRNQLISALAMFGIWKAGAIFAPINFGLTERLLAYQVGDTQPVMLLAERALVPALNAISEQLGQVAPLAHVVVYDPPAGSHDAVADGVAYSGPHAERDWAALLQPAPKPDVALAYDDLCNIIYTSGTTGPSKGVVQSHRWMNQYTYLFRQMLNGHDVVYNDLPMYHVGGAVFNVVRAVWAGSGLACWDRFSPNDFWRRIALSGATSAVLVDTMISWLAKAAPAATDRHNSLNKVYMQPLPERHGEIARRFGFDFVTAGFGQTESGMSCFTIIEETDASCESPPAYRRGQTREAIRAQAAALGVELLAPAQAGQVGKGYLGHPCLFVEAAVLDERDGECAVGVAGQLAFRSKLPYYLLVEYLGKPQATAKAFRNLWFHTGDSALRHANGSLSFVDRMGDRIRVRGENISSFHIEDMLNQYPAVEMTAAFAIPAHEGDEDDVVVYVVAREQQVIDRQALQAWCDSKMPKFMRPRHIRVVEQFPRTLTQKIEKFKLKAMILAELQGQTPSPEAARPPAKERRMT
ncbi:crotonobetaine/carnitine-CoA ligase [Comamonas sp. BIGb0152]|uniref:class I adenylate-forming enzyme family protein n=1 Tax=Comamonas sp. BIGb0152 TaxID=2940601 RepID=UPI002167E37C|nr:AMP-binding protein [Comamonas sp. BIGb0152]MCS4294919.1 crotonobetaine/carnitine-CoA ligase [Comamonas sp. BIGb0152]